MEDEWMVDANEAITLSLVRPGPALNYTNIVSFKPKFTYPIFGEEERIFGYKGLKINIRFDARDLRPHFSVASSRKFTSVGDVEALDVKEKMKEYLPGVAFQSNTGYELNLNVLPEPWSPPGTLVDRVEKNGEVYEIWHGTLAMPAVHQMMKRIQIAVLFYIEGGSYITELDETDESESYLARWSVYWVYKVETLPSPDPELLVKFQYTFQGFATTYNFWMFQGSTPPSSPDAKKDNDSLELSKSDSHVDMIHRMRISQFLILPPFQGKGIGSLLYSTLFNIAMKSSTTVEVTIEDPNEDFDLLRDLCDIKYLRQNVPEFAELEVNTDIPLPEKGGLLHNNTQVSLGNGSRSNEGIVNMKKLESIRVKNKIAPRQFSRLVEMQLMSKLPDSVRPRSDPEVKKPAASKSDKHQYDLWRLLLKQRLYRRNVSILGEFEITERIIKLNETLDNVEWEYARILDRLEPKAVTSSTIAIVSGKRKSNGEASSENHSSKKVRISDE
ncbi:acyl-CoA N-acyltransferase [Annulohypoxylon maeteangense]|uniref:acyl-CoA N-acyltransferase n=1 Tax=Annulohypoxylon maeteangense TaxID=1927788 RepID=UPI0020076B4C|nr:acyl-CoA N-acyltransferase [Annulohypoxylon maeteangense]KAI0883444.1 acyl-CoA N-acyltransferase [Annulohypoxylon maeteangense]